MYNGNFQEFLNISVEENYSLSERILKLTAEDEDRGKNGLVDFRLAFEGDFEYFQVRNGEVYFSRLPDYELKNIFNLVVFILILECG